MPSFMHCRQTLYHLSHQGSPIFQSQKSNQSLLHCRCLYQLSYHGSLNFKCLKDFYMKISSRQPDPSGVPEILGQNCRFGTYWNRASFFIFKTIMIVPWLNRFLLGVGEIIILPICDHILFYFHSQQITENIKCGRTFCVSIFYFTDSSLYYLPFLCELISLSKILRWMLS